MLTLYPEVTTHLWSEFSKYLYLSIPCLTPLDRTAVSGADPVKIQKVSVPIIIQLNLSYIQFRHIILKMRNPLSSHGNVVLKTS